MIRRWGKDSVGSHAEDLGWEDLAGVLAWVCAIPGLIFSYVAAAGYIPLDRFAWLAGRRGRK